MKQIPRIALMLSLLFVLGGFRGQPASQPSPRKPLDLRGHSAELSPARKPLYPLRVSANRRYLVDQRGRPFLIVGDSPQALVVKISLKDAARFLANHERAGFNSVWVNLLCNAYTGGREDGATFDRVSPFTTFNDLSSLNEAYFRRVDAIVRIAAKHGIVVFLDPIETGGWLRVLAANGVARDEAYGRYLGRRYRKFPNIVWSSGNDFFRWRKSSSDRLALAVARGIRATDKTHLQTVELDPESSSLDDPRWAKLVKLDAAYTHAPTYAEVLKEYNRSRHLPTFLVEASYEFEFAYTGPATLRRQEYWTMLSGAAGQLFGNKYTWQFLPSWKKHLNDKGVTDLEHVASLLSSRPWFKLVPDQAHTVVTNGYGTFARTGDLNDNDLVTTARTLDGTLVISYLPTLHDISVNMAKLSGPVVAQWYDPASGRYLAISGSPFDNSGERTFTSPGPNADGDQDWVLVLTAPSS